MRMPEKKIKKKFYILFAFATVYLQFLEVNVMMKDFNDIE